MKNEVLSLPTLEDLRHHVYQMLCSHDHLDLAQTPMQEVLLKRSGKPCGMTFQVNGPRMVKTYAVWAAQERRILFYDSTVMRFAETRLMKSPGPKKLAA